VECGRHIDSKTGAEAEAARIKGEILAGTFVCAAERRQPVSSPGIGPSVITLKGFGQLYLDRHIKTCGKKTWSDDAARLNRLAAFILPGPDGATRPFGEKTLSLPHLQSLVIAALETGCRQGELLSLKWNEVDQKQRELTLRAGNTKDEEDRILPISSRLAAVLEMVRTDPAGRAYPPTAYVFGELGKRTKSVKKAWQTCVLKAHGYEPQWVKHGKLSAESPAPSSERSIYIFTIYGTKPGRDGWRRGGRSIM
jgi:integrase